MKMLNRTRNKARADSLPVSVPAIAADGATVQAAPKWVRRLAVALELFLVILLAHMVVRMVYASLTPAPGLTAVMASPRPTGRVEADYGILKSFDPFFRQIMTEGAPSQAAAPESSLKIQLFGLRAAGNGKGRAIVRMLEDEQKAVGVGDDIAPGVRVAGIYADRIEITRRGVREAVFLRPASERTAQQSATSPTVNRKPSARPAAQGADASIDAGKAIAAVLADAGLTPVRDGSHIRGFALPEGDVAPLLAAAGLEGGDILLSVAGQPLTSFERLKELGDEIDVRGPIVLEIDRRGEVTTLTLAPLSPVFGQ